MRSKIAENIYNETPQEVKDLVKAYAAKIVDEYYESKRIGRESMKRLYDRIQEAKKNECDPKVKSMKTIEEKRLDMSREAWIKNVMRVLKLSHEEAERQYYKIWSGDVKSDFRTTDQPQPPQESE